MGDVLHQTYDVRCVMFVVLFQTSDVSCQMSDVSFRMSEVRRLMYDIWCLMSDVWCLLSDVRCVIFVVWCQTSDISCLNFFAWCLMSNVWCLLSDVRQLMSGVWCQTFVVIGNTRIFRTLVQTSKLSSPADEQNYSVYTMKIMKHSLLMWIFILTFTPDCNNIVLEKWKKGKSQIGIN